MTLLLDESLLSKIAHFVSVVVDCDIVKNNTDDNITPPVFITCDRTDQFVTIGLCNVARQIIKHSMKLKEKEEQKKEIELLLGYKQNCLKGAAAISKWTEFCEKNFPLGVGRLIEEFRRRSEKVILVEELIQLEKEFMVPKKTANAMKHKLAGRVYPLNMNNTVDVNMIKKVLSDINMKLCANSPCYSSLSPLIKHTENIMKRKNQIFWPYLCGFDMTIADLLILAVLLELLCSMHCSCVITEFFILFPNIFRWFSFCCLKPTIISAIQKLWSTDCDQMCSNLKFPISCDVDCELVHNVSYVKKSINTKQMHLKITKGLPLIIKKLSDSNIRPKFESDNQVGSICWSELPVEVNPTEGELNLLRALRKRQQIENMVSLILPLLNNGDKIVEFCAGGGHLGIVVAYLKPDCHVVLLENKEESIDRALSRIKRLGLSNVSLYLSNIEYFTADFNVGIALHACGSATDLVLQKSIAARASFVISPCCYGGIRASNSLSYPASKTFKESGIGDEDFTILSHSADQTCSDYDSEYSKQGKSCMLFVDYDRTLKAEEIGGYETKICSMVPESCSPKNNVIVGKNII